MRYRHLLRKASKPWFSSNIAIDDFFNSKILLPSLEEQTAIAEVLSAADREIELLRQDIEQEKQRKKALMQLLLTEL